MMSPEELLTAVSLITADPTAFERYGAMCIVAGYDACVAKAIAAGPLYCLVDGEYREIKFARAEAIS